MKPPLFHVGQAVVCTTGSSKWRLPSCVSTTPQKGRIYTISRIDYGKAWHVRWWQFWRKKYFLELAEMPAELWAATNFAPVELLPDEELAELLAEALESVTT